MRQRLMGAALAAVTMMAAGDAAAEAVRVGGSLQLLPIGEAHVEGLGFEGTADTETAFAVGGNVEIPLHPNFAVGFTPRIILGVKGEGADESAKQLDLAARLIGGTQLTGTTTRIYGYASPGYSIILAPDQPDDVDRPAGFILGFGAGAGFRINPQVEITAELGYQLGFQKVSEGGESLEISTDFLHIGAGVLMSL